MGDANATPCSSEEGEKRFETLDGVSGGEEADDREDHSPSSSPNV